MLNKLTFLLCLSSNGESSGHLVVCTEFIDFKLFLSFRRFDFKRWNKSSIVTIVVLSIFALGQQKLDWEKEIFTLKKFEIYEEFFYADAMFVCETRIFTISAFVKSSSNFVCTLPNWFVWLAHLSWLITNHSPCVNSAKLTTNWCAD